MSNWTLADIRTKVRNITGAPSEDQLATAVLDDYINDYYVFTMPFELKVQIANQFLKFKTTPGIDVYAFPGGYFTDAPGAYADGFPLVFYQDPDVFYQDWPQQYAVDNIAVGDGIVTTFTGGVQNPPIQIGSLFISDGFQTVSDDGTGGLTGDGSGTINYVTGAYSVTFTNPPAATLTIYAKYIGYQANRPQGVLFFNNQFTFRPIPDQAYQIQMQGYIKPVLLVNASDTPLQEEWGPCLAYGAALEIFSDRGDTESLNDYAPMLKRYENVALARSIQQYTQEQSVGRF